MPLIKRCFCFSLETGTKIIGYMQLILGLILVVLVFVNLVLALYLKDELLTVAHNTVQAYNETDVDLEEKVAVAKVAYAYVVIAMVLVLAYVLFSTLMGALLLAGVYKRKLNYVKWWIRIKTGLVMMAVGFVLLQLLLLLFGMDADLTKPILSLVYDGCLIMIVNSYYDEENYKSADDDDFKPRDNFNDGVPPPAYC